MDALEFKNALQTIYNSLYQDILPYIASLDVENSLESIVISEIPVAQGLQGIQGIQGLLGISGSNGVGVPLGGLTDQILSKIDDLDYNTQWSTLPFIPTLQTAKLIATEIKSTTTLTDVEALSLPMVANGVYRVECFLTFQSVATTTGLGLGFLAPTGACCMVETVVPITSTGVSSQLRTIFPSGVSALNSGSVLGTGVTAINSNHTARISGIVRNGVTAGNFKIQARTEVSASNITLRIGSELQLVRIG